jgi:hypothetical protein
MLVDVSDDSDDSDDFNFHSSKTVMNERSSDDSALQIRSTKKHRHIQQVKMMKIDSDSDDDHELFKEDAENGLSWDKAQTSINANHPRMFEYDKLGKMKYSLWPVKQTSFGWLSHDPQKRDTPLAEYGAGTVLYFQFVKHMARVFLALSLLSLPSLCLYYSGNTVFSADL